MLLAAAFRFVAPDWDGGIAAHPDERFLLGVAAEVPLYANICDASPGFPYGHLPVTLGRLVVLAAPSADPLYAARLLSALAGLVLVALTGAWGRALAGRRAGLLATTVAAFSPLLIQQAHYFTVDVFGAAIACGAVLAARRRRWRVSGVLLGLSIACKLSLAVGALPLLGAVIWQRPASRNAGDSAGSWQRSSLLFLGFAALAFSLASPWSLLAPTACWQGPFVQSLMASGRLTMPYTLQYAGTAPYVYPLVQMAVWGLGLPATALGLYGLAAFGVRSGVPRRILVSPGWSWPTFYFLVVAGLSVKFPRYLVPVYPLWAAWAAWAVVKIERRHPWSRKFLTVAVAAATAVLGLAQIGVYREPHPWVSASKWVYHRLAPGAVVSIEAWDHPLPVPLPEGDASAFTQLVVPVFDDESRAKADALAEASVESAVIIVATRRGYGALARQPDRFGPTLVWYRDVIRERERYVFARCPRIGPLAITDDPLLDAGIPTAVTLAARCGARYTLRLPRLDESYRVYDAPMTIVLAAAPAP